MDAIKNMKQQQLEGYPFLKNYNVKISENNQIIVNSDKSAYLLKKEIAAELGIFKNCIDYKGLDVSGNKVFKLPSDIRMEQVLKSLGKSEY